MKLRLYLQKATSHSEDLPKLKTFVQWGTLAFQIAPHASDLQQYTTVEITIRLVDESESAELNKQYRNKSGPTNILSFPAEPMVKTKSYYLGDLLICVPLVYKEAIAENKLPIAHWAHLTVHGILHLLDYDHEKESDAVVMEALETAILKRLGYEDPYHH